MMKIKFLFLLSALVTAGAFAQPAKPFHVLHIFHIASPGGWDYIAVGPGNGSLYVSHGTQVNILDLKTGDSTGVIPNTTGVHGIAFDKANNKGFTSNGRLNNVTVFDLKTNAILAQVPTGMNPDAIMYEPFSKRIITCNGKSKSLSFIDPVNNILVDSIDVGGKPETAVSNEKGMLYVNIEDKNEIVAINLKTMKVEAHWPLAPAEEPTGLVYDKTTNRLFAGCGNKMLAMADATSGKVITTVPIGDGCDGIAFDPATKNIFASNGSDGTLSVYNEKTANSVIFVETAATKKSARTITIDEQTHLLYLPAADTEADPVNPKGRGKMVPGTFQVLVTGQ